MCTNILNTLSINYINEHSTQSTLYHHIQKYCIGDQSVEVFNVFLKQQQQQKILTAFATGNTKTATQNSRI